MLEYLILGVVQGLTEWLPLSSSGHLVLLQRIFGVENPVFLDAVLHLASVLVLVCVLRNEILNLIKSLFVGKKMGERKLLGLLFLGTLPVVVVGILMRGGIESAFLGTLWLPMGFAITGLALMASGKPLFKKRRLDFVTALAVGLAQAAAVLPGISRSGLTIATAIMLGVKRETSARFSLLLAIPALTGAFLLQAFSAPWGAMSLEWGGIALGFFSAIVAGYLSIRVLLNLVRAGRLKVFAYWCLIMALLSLIVVF